MDGFPVAVLRKYQTLDVLNSRNVLSHSSEAKHLKSRCSQGRTPLKALGENPALYSPSFQRLLAILSMVAQLVKNPPANAGDPRDMGLIPGSGRSPGEGNGNLLQYSFLENSMDRGAWWTTVHGVAKSRTRLSTYSHLACRCFSLVTWPSSYQCLHISFLLVCLPLYPNVPFSYNISDTALGSTLLISL